MKIKYTFVTGEEIKIEVDDALSQEIEQIKNYVYNNNHKETRRHESYSDNNGKRDMFVDKIVDVEEDALRKIENAELMNALEKLLPQQRELVQKVFFEGLSETEIAREMGISQPAISKQLKVIYKKLKNFLK